YAPHRRDEIRLVPFVNDDQVGAVHQFGHVGGPFVLGGLELRIIALERRERTASVVLDEVEVAPGARGLISENVMSATEEFAQHTPQEMSIAMVPAGAKRMGEVDDLHSAATASGTTGWRR